MNTATLILATTIVLCLVFAAAYGFARRIDNYGIVDVVWSYAFAGVAVGLAFAGDGWLPRRIMMAGLVCLWSVRLGTHLARRVAAYHPHEDTRYRKLRAEWTRHFDRRMFGFFQLQALSVVVLAAPLFLVMRHQAPAIHALEVIGLALAIVALAGEATADAQLNAFKRDPSARGRVCARGLWAWSRHPNYFFEWLVWVAFAFIALASPWGWLGLIAPASMLVLLLRVTGIPLLEQQALESKGEAYRRYQQTTSAFVPWPPKRPPVDPTNTTARRAIPGDSPHDRFTP